MGDQTKWLVRLVAAVWTLNLLAGIASGMTTAFDYTPSEAVNGIFMLIVGSLFVADRTLKKEDAREAQHERDKDKDQP